MSRPKPTVGSRELKTRLGMHLERVRAGATLVITHRGHPVAELRPLNVAAHAAGRLAELEELGIVSSGRSRGPLRPFKPIASRPVSNAPGEDREERF